MDVAAERASLDAIFGPTSGDLDVELWVGHPEGGGSEVVGDGYSPGTVAAGGWEPANADGTKPASAAVDCGTPTDAWTGPATHYRLVDGVGVSWGDFPIPSNQQKDVGGAGSAYLILPEPFFGDNEL